MSKFEVFVREGASVDGFSSSAIVTGEVATLNHELRNDSVEMALFVSQRFACQVTGLVTQTKMVEVGRSLGHHIVVKLENNSSNVLLVDWYVEEYVSHLDY